MDLNFLLIFLLLQFPPLGAADSPLIYLGCYLKNNQDTPNATFENQSSFRPWTSGSGGHPIKILPLLIAPSSSVLDLWFLPKVSEGDTTLENPRHCVTACHRNSFRYAGLSSPLGMDRNCLCGSSYGRFGIGHCSQCTTLEVEHCGSETSFSIYDTGFKVPSPPQDLILVQRGENTLRISWSAPVATNGPLTGYHIFANKLFTYSHSGLVHHPRTWRVNDVDMELLLTGLVPGTEYNVTVVAVNSEGESLPVMAKLWSKIGVPDPPSPPSILEHDSMTMTIKFSSVRNSKGPLSKYRIVMIDESRLFQTRFFTMDRVATWNDSMSIGYPKYITAEFRPDEFPPNGRFVIGNGGYYDGFYNGRIPDGHWHPSLGIVSTLNGVTEISYSATSHEQHESVDIDPFRDPSSKNPEENPGTVKSKNPLQSRPDVVIVNENSGIVTALWIAITITGGILFVCVSTYSILKLKLIPKRNGRRSSFSAPLSRSSEAERPTELMTCTNPSYIFPDDFNGGYTHSGFVPDEDCKCRALERLKHVWYVPRNFIAHPTEDEDSVYFLGNGRYGPVHCSELKSKDAGTLPVTLFTIPGHFLKAEGKNRVVEDMEKFFTELDDLVRIDPHENVLKLIGFMEDGDSLLFAVEFGGTSLKNWLLDVRGTDCPENDVNTPYNFLLCAMNIAEAMFHLSSFKITHGELAASNVHLTKLEVPKLTGFGILKCNPPNGERDFTRWGAVEQFQNRCTKPCDLWSFGILLWEIATLGGTPYHDVRREDLQKRICRGLRPAQVEVIGDSLYQVMLHCWQLDRDERPDFDSLSCSLHDLLSRSKESLFISPSFNYPPYIHDFEYTK